MYNYLISTSSKEIIANGCKTAGISDAVKKGSSCLESLDFFSSIDPLDQQIEVNILYYQTTYPNAEFIQGYYDHDDEDEWVTEDLFDERSNFWILDDEMLY